MKKLIFILFVSCYIPVVTANFQQERNYSIRLSRNDTKLTESLLVSMLKSQQFHAVEKMLAIYQNIDNPSPQLINYTKIYLAQQYYRNKQYKRALSLFLELKKQANLTDKEKVIIEQYLSILEEQESWHFSFSANYLRNKNVNNASAEYQIEDTGFTKNNDMLPQSATGLAYYFSAERNLNVVDSHYLHFSNELLGKYYWDNKDFDESNNRTYIGYIYQNAKLKFASKAFYERQWFARHRYNWANGFRTELEYSLAPKWKISTAIELSQPHYFKQREKNGTIKLISSTLIWQPNHLSYLYWGIDFIREKTQVKQYSNDTKGLRLGWSRIWTGNFITQINSSISWRNYKDKASLGGILPLDKIRKDKIYNANLTVWKSDWNWLGFTPKIQLKYKKQKSRGCPR